MYIKLRQCLAHDECSINSSYYSESSFDHQQPLLESYIA